MEEEPGGLWLVSTRSTRETCQAEPTCGGHPDDTGDSGSQGWRHVFPPPHPAPKLAIDRDRLDPVFADIHEGTVMLDAAMPKQSSQQCSAW
jgi:hypothetical protein